MKTALITGASRGIGAETARLFAENGFRVIVHYHRSRNAAEQLACSLPGAFAVQADVADGAQVAAMFERVYAQVGFIDVLVNNAGIAQQKLFTELSASDWQRMMQVHIDGAFHCCRAVVPSMVREKRGKIINISSIWGLAGASCEVHYSTAKAALIGFTKALAKELAPSNIQVNCVAPGVINTDMCKDFDSETLAALCEETPLGRLGTPADVAGAVCFLASRAADFITGQVLSPNGGIVI